MTYVPALHDLDPKQFDFIKRAEENAVKAMSEWDIELPSLPKVLRPDLGAVVRSVAALRPEEAALFLASVYYGLDSVD